MRLQSSGRPSAHDLASMHDKAGGASAAVSNTPVWWQSEIAIMLGSLRWSRRGSLWAAYEPSHMKSVTRGRGWSMVVDPLDRDECRTRDVGPVNEDSTAYDKPQYTAPDLKVETPPQIDPSGCNTDSAVRGQFVRVPAVTRWTQSNLQRPGWQYQD
jgi:hypothetical protein